MDHHHPMAQKWRQEADRDEQRGLKDVAAMGRHFADELDGYERDRGQERLTLSQAAAESGRHKDTIARYIDQGDLENVGKKGSPLVRRGDLLAKLKKPTRRKTTLTSTGGPNLVEAALAEQGILPAES
jgi:hypothetical protein